jgi:hypothetical protein
MSIRQLFARIDQRLLLLLIVLAALLFRRYDAFVNPQLWAEDGNLFLAQYYQLGIRSVVTPYAGYLHVIIRLIVAFFGSVGFNLLYIPTLYCVTIVAIYYGIALRLWRSAVASGVLYPYAYAALFVYVPVMSDVFMNITNLNGILSLYLINHLFLREHGIKSAAGRAADLVVVALISVSGTGALLLLPVLPVVLLVQRRHMNLKRLLPIAIIGMGGLVQLVYVKFLDPNFYRGVDGTADNNHLLMFFANNAADILLLHDANIQPPVWTYIAAFSLLAALFIWRFVKLRDDNKYILLMAALVCVASVIYAYWPKESFLLALHNASRYFIVPYTCLGWLLLLSLGTAIRHRIVVGVYIAYFLLQHKQICWKLTDMHWKWQVMEIREGKRQEFEINPGWKFTLPEKAWK